MAEKSCPFDAVVGEDGQADRVFNSADFARMFAMFFMNGVYSSPSDCLQVMSSSGMVVAVKPGTGYVKGRVYENDADLAITINTANANYNRKDIIVLRLDLTDRDIKVLYRPGTASASPVAVDLVRTEDIHDLKLAEIFVGSGVTTITQANITDTRIDTSVCGYVDNVIKNVDTTTIFNQYMDYWNTVKAQIDSDMAQFSSGYNLYGVAAGTGTYTATVSGFALTEGINVKVKFTNGYSSGQATLNINSLGAKPITRADGSNAKIVAGSIINLIYDGTNFIPAGDGLAGTALPAQVLQGVTFSNDDGFQSGAMADRKSVV